MPPMSDGGRDDDDDDAVESPPMIAQPETDAHGQTPQTRAEIQAANDFIRDIAGRVALELATTPEGRAAGLSVEVWPSQGVWMRVRKGHELRVFAERRETVMWIRWERVDPATRGSRPQTSQGSLGKLRMMGTEDLRAFMARWLAWRARG
ncbi:hypothetical protein [Paraliomyxa miuraensis]|uniref:hypothetical protein n=1 Tax=Paraliomyxa miuraensis TaxID=376150 RepID=UPI002253B980|nr:hypothetical protein [Paraliomyxa miuraensis]MCX4244954.1 hypothetical protein [Paraliomyxa miuraensis]